WLFNRSIKLSTRVYIGIVARLLRVSVLVLVVYGGLIVLTYWGYLQLPTGFIPTQDKGYLVASVQLPDAASAERTREVIKKLERISLDTPGVKNVNSVAGNSFQLSAYGSNFGSMFIILTSFDVRRKSPDLYHEEIINNLKKRFAAEIPEAMINVFPPPAVSGVGRAGGLKLMIEDRGNGTLSALQRQTNAVIGSGNGQEAFNKSLSTVYKADSPQLFVDVNREACLSQGINLVDVFGTMQAYLGSRYVNDFNRFGRTWQVVVQADSKFRDNVEDVKRLAVRNSHGQMVPLGTLAEVKPISGPLVLTRYNMYPAAAITGSLA